MNRAVRSRIAQFLPLYILFRSPFRHCRTMAMQIPSTAATLKPAGGGSFTLRGRSRAGDGTTFIIPELKWMFDMGALVQQATPSVVFLTHTHNDHITFMPQILTNAIKHVDVYLPTKALPLVKNYIRAYQDLLACGEEEDDSDNSETQSAPNYTLHPVEFGNVFDIYNRGTKYSIEALQCHHRIDCLGFSISRTVKVLKREYIGLPGREIAKLRKQGASTHDEHVKPFLCHLGDTTHMVFERHPEILEQHKYIVVECSFFCDKTRQKAKDTKHMHWVDLKPIVEANPKVLFILIHFSLRYSPVEIRNFFANATTTHNVHPMLLEHELRSKIGRVSTCDCFECALNLRHAKQTKRAATDDHHPHAKSGRGPLHLHKRPEKRFDKRSDNEPTR